MPGLLKDAAARQKADQDASKLLTDAVADANKHTATIAKILPLPGPPAPPVAPTPLAGPYSSKGATGPAALLAPFEGSNGPTGSAGRPKR